MTKLQFNTVGLILDRLTGIREALPHDDTAREYLYRAETALRDMLAYTVPNARA